MVEMRSLEQEKGNMPIKIDLQLNSTIDSCESVAKLTLDISNTRDVFAELGRVNFYPYKKMS